MLLTSGNPFTCHEEFFFVFAAYYDPTQKRFDIFTPRVECSEGLEAFRFFFKQQIRTTYEHTLSEKKEMYYYSLCLVHIRRYVKYKHTIMILIRIILLVSQGD